MVGGVVTTNRVVTHHHRAIKAAEEMDIMLDEFDDVLQDEDDVEPAHVEAQRLKARDDARVSIHR